MKTKILCWLTCILFGIFWFLIIGNQTAGCVFLAAAFVIVSGMGKS